MELNNHPFVRKGINVSIPYSSGLGLEHFDQWNLASTFRKVSIPYSSGLGLEHKNGVTVADVILNKSQSLIHQV